MDTPKIIVPDQVMEGIALSNTVSTHENQKVHPSEQVISLEIMPSFKQPDFNQIPVATDKPEAREDPIRQLQLQKKLDRLNSLFAMSEQEPLNAELKKYLTQFWTLEAI